MYKFLLTNTTKLLWDIIPTAIRNNTNFFNFIPPWVKLKIKKKKKSKLKKI